MLVRGDIDTRDNSIESTRRRTRRYGVSYSPRTTDAFRRFEYEEFTIEPHDRTSSFAGNEREHRRRSLGARVRTASADGTDGTDDVNVITEELTG